MFIESINEGFRLTHRNPQLIYIRIALVFIIIAGFFFMVGLPVIAAGSIIGMDMSHAKELFYSFAQDPFDIFSRYIGLLFIILISFMLYLVFASLLHLYILGGTLGELKISALDTRSSFSFSSFLKEARKNLFTLLWLISITTTGFFVLFVLFSILSVAGLVISGTLDGGGVFIQNFLDSFFSLSVMVFGSIISIASLTFIIYSVVVAVVEPDGVLIAIKKTFVFLRERPSAFFFYFILMAGIAVVNILIFALEIPLKMAFDTGLLTIIFLILLNMIFKSYLIVVMWSCLVVFYIKAVNYRASKPSYDI
jgi:hypothetical protein